MTRRVLAVALTFALLVPAALVTAGPAAAATTTKVIEFNAAQGKACQKRCLAPVASLLASNVDFYALQEVCKDDLVSFANEKGLQWAFSAQTTGDGRCKGSDRGNALLTRYSLTDQKVFPLAAPTTPTGNAFTLLCAIVHKPNQRLQGCSTHLIAGGSPDRASQVKQIVGYTQKARQKGKRVIVAGDFNLRQGDAVFKPMKRSFAQKHPGNATGVYVQYVWFSLPGVSGLTAKKADGGTSDHDVLISTARLS